MTIRPETATEIMDRLNDATPWERVPTDIEGVYLVKSPSAHDVSKVYVNVVHSCNRSGVMLKVCDDLDYYLDVFQDVRLRSLLEFVVGLNEDSASKPISVRVFD